LSTDERIILLLDVPLLMSQKRTKEGVFTAELSDDMPDDWPDSTWHPVAGQPQKSCLWNKDRVKT